MKMFIEITQNKEEVLEILKRSGIEPVILDIDDMYSEVIENETSLYMKNNQDELEENYESRNLEITLEEYSEKLVEKVSHNIYKYGNISEEIQNTVSYTNDWNIG